MTIIKTFVARIKHTFTADTAAVLSFVSKFEAMLEAAIAKDMKNLGVIAEAKATLERTRALTDSNINASYKLLHKIAG